VVAVQADKFTSGVEGVQRWIAQTDTSLAMAAGYSALKENMFLFYNNLFNEKYYKIIINAVR